MFLNNTKNNSLRFQRQVLNAHMWLYICIQHILISLALHVKCIFSLNILIIFCSCNWILCESIGGLIVASQEFLILSSVSLFSQTFAVRSRLCVSVSQRASPQILHTDTCLYVLITDVYFTPTLASSRPPMALPLFPCPVQVQHRWHKAAWLACHTSISLQEAAGESKLS